MLLCIAIGLQLISTVAGVALWCYSSKAEEVWLPVYDITKPLLDLKWTTRKLMPPPPAGQAVRSILLVITLAQSRLAVITGGEACMHE